MLSVTPLYAGLIGLLFVWLSAQVIMQRFRAKVSVGDGGDKALIKRIRVQANCAEYAPLGLLLLGFAELQGAPAGALHAMGMMLLAGRVLHAYGFARTPQLVLARRIGILLTYLMLVLASLANIGHALT